MMGAAEFDIRGRRVRVQQLTNILCFLIVSLSLAGCNVGVSKPGEGVTAPAVTAPVITTQPTNQTVIAGETATFSVMAAGTGPLNYQWQKGTTPVSGATSASYTTPATTTADNGLQFSVVVSNSAGSVTSNTATLTVNPAPAVPLITQQPSNQTVNAGQTASFSVMAVGVAPLTYQWQKGTTPISGETSASYTTLPTTTADNGSQYRVVVSNANGNATSNAATLTVSTATAATIDVLTQHNDVGRTGQNLNETTLTTSNVTSAKFGKLGFYSADGLVDAQPLYASNVAVPSNGTHNILIVASEHDSVYAFDADSGATLWQLSMLKSVIEQMHNQLLRGLVLLGHHTGLIPIRSLVDRHARPLRQQHRLISMPGRVVERLHARRVVGASLIAPRQNSHGISTMT